MASKKYLELQEIADVELLSELESTEKEYQRMRFDHAAKGLENPLELRDIRRDIARLNTEIRRRQLAAATPEQLAKRSKIRARRRSR